MTPAAPCGVPGGRGGTRGRAPRRRRPTSPVRGATGGSLRWNRWKPASRRARGHRGPPRGASLRVVHAVYRDPPGMEWITFTRERLVVWGERHRSRRSAAPR